MLLCICRVNLDVFWSRATKTVKANLNRIILDSKAADRLFWMNNYLPQLGWPTLEDRVGILAVIITLNASLHPGKYAGHHQSDLVRKTPTWFRAIHMSGAGYTTEIIYEQDEKNVHATTCVTAGEWSIRFKLA